jgi:hypothetical protein
VPSRYTIQMTTTSAMLRIGQSSTGFCRYGVGTFYFFSLSLDQEKQDIMISLQPQDVMLTYYDLLFFVCKLDVILDVSVLVL